MIDFQTNTKKRLPDFNGISQVDKGSLVRANESGVDFATLNQLADKLRKTPTGSLVLVDDFTPPQGLIPSNSFSYWREKSVGQENWPSGFEFTPDEFYKLQLPRTLTGNKKLAIDYVRQLQRCCLTWILDNMDYETTESGSIPGQWEDRLFELRELMDLLDMLPVALIKGTDILWLVNSKFSGSANSDRLMFMRDFLRDGFLRFANRFPSDIDDGIPRKDYVSFREHIWFFNGLHELLTAIYHKLQDLELLEIENEVETPKESV